MPRSFAIALLATLVLSTLAAAQQIIVPAGILTAGQTIDVGYQDAGRANGSVTITVDNGDPLDPQRIDLEVKLDGNGKGSASFTVPNWWSATFNGGTAKEVTRFVEEPRRANA